MSWQPIETAPRTGSSVLLLLGETIPDMPNVRVGGYVSGDEAEDLGYREYAKYGGWLIWNSGSDFYVEDITEPTHWMPHEYPPAPEAKT